MTVRSGRGLRADFQIETQPCSARKYERQFSGILRQPIGQLRERDYAREHDAIETFIRKRHGRGAKLWRQHAAAALSHVPADLEYVGEICRKAEAQRGGHLPLAVVGEGELLVETALPKQARALDVDHPFRRQLPSKFGQWTIRHVGAKVHVVLAYAGTQQRGRLAADSEIEPRQQTCVVAKQTVTFAGHITQLIGDEKFLVVLKRVTPHRGSWPPLRTGGGYPAPAIPAPRDGNKGQHIFWTLSLPKSAARTSRGRVRGRDRRAVRLRIVLRQRTGR